ncbi:MAG: cysteine peptidase family C39 domain-containing protein [Desulfomonilia bacterium]|nr:cysteine peptidase family C39 domain-containing protein [Desulfomonilia bacterium]
MKLLILLFAIFSLSGEASGIEGVPFVRQESHFCGPAALSSVMAYYGRDIDQGTIAQTVYCEGLKGSLITDLETYARRKGFNTRLAQGKIDDLRRFTDAGQPVIVLVDMGFWVVSRPHYLVVTDVMDSSLRAHTGHQAAQIFSREEFESIWKKKGSVYLLVFP